MMRPEPNQPNPPPLRTLNLEPEITPAKPQSVIVSPTTSNLPASGRRLPAQLPPTRNANGIGRSKEGSFGIAKWFGLGAIGIGACLAVALRQSFPANVVEEKGHRNWKYVELATEQTAAANGETRIVVLGPNKKTRIESSLSLGDKQKDISTTTTVAEAFKVGAFHDAVNAIAAAQQIPEPVNPRLDPASGEKLRPQIAAPTISEGMKQELLAGDINFFHLFIYDSCAEDGDVVDVILDGQAFARVPITNQGATLSIPMANGRVTAVAIQGVYDGGGGITVAFHSSGGDAFLGVLDAGQTVPLGVVGK